MNASTIDKFGVFVDVPKLLARERRACAQVVRAYKRKIGNERPEIGYGHILDACDDILKAMTERGKK